MANLREDEIKHLARLSALSLTQEELQKISPQLSQTITFVEKLSKLDSQISKLGETHQVSGLKNIFREDIVDSSRSLNQKQALAGAKNTFRGFFLVNKII